MSNLVQAGRGSMGKRVWSVMIEIFLHQRGRATEFVEVDPARTVEQFGIECLGPGATVWLEDAAGALSARMSMEAVGVTARSHVHVSPCPKIFVKVRFAGDTIECDTPPATTVGRVHKWAASPEGFKLTDSEAAKHVLAICDTKTELDQAEHIGFYADVDCSVCLDLVPKDRFAG